MSFVTSRMEVIPSDGIVLHQYTYPTISLSHYSILLQKYPSFTKLKPAQMSGRGTQSHHSSLFDKFDPYDLSTNSLLLNLSFFVNLTCNLCICSSF